MNKSLYSTENCECYQLIYTCYWMNNSIVVHYNGRSYEISVVDRGVPQGSVLGPLYFVLFTADVFGAIHGFADDMLNSLTSTNCSIEFMEMP